MAHNEHIRRILKTGNIGDVVSIDDEEKAAYSELLAKAKKKPSILANRVKRSRMMAKLLERVQAEDKDFYEYLQPPLSGFETYNVPYPLGQDVETDENLSPELIEAINVEIRRIEIVLETGVDDQREMLDPVRRKTFEREVAEFNPNDYPEVIPQSVSDLECNIFGHICPVVFVGESITETTETRRRGRYISFRTKMRVVRRDNYTCQQCGKHLRDDEVEFDHIIPHAKGGSCEEHNIRLTCFDCNRDKSDGFEM